MAGTSVANQALISVVERGSCQDLDPKRRDAFFSHKRREIAWCQALCRACPVRRRCLSYALNQEILTGVWGETDEWERQRDLAMRADGRPFKHARDPRCPACRSHQLSLVIKLPGQASGYARGLDALEIVHRAKGAELRDASRGARVHCDNCGLEWPGWAVVMSRALEKSKVYSLVAS